MTSKLSPHRTINLDFVEKLVLLFLSNQDILSIQMQNKNDISSIQKQDLNFMLRLANKKWTEIISKIQDRIYSRYLDISIMLPISNFVSNPKNISESYLKLNRLRIVLDTNVSKYPIGTNIIEEDGEYYFPINTANDAIQLSVILSMFPEDNTYINLKIDKDIKLDIPWPEHLKSIKCTLDTIQKNIKDKTFNDFVNCFKKK